VKGKFDANVPMTTTGNEATRVQYLPPLWPLWQSGAAVEHNDVILTNLMTSHFLCPSFLHNLFHFSNPSDEDQYLLKYFQNETVEFSLKNHMNQFISRKFLARIYWNQL
jgi:hypothetical protein